jgi:hypothetical protein
VWTTSFLSAAMIRRSQNPPNEAEAPADAAHSHLSRVSRAVYHMPSDQPALHQRPLRRWRETGSGRDAGRGQTRADLFGVTRADVEPPAAGMNLPPQADGRGAAPSRHGLGRISPVLFWQGLREEGAGVVEMRYATMAL